MSLTTNSLERTLSRHEENLKKMSTCINKACANEIRELEEAQRRFESRLQKVMKSQELVDIDNENVRYTNEVAGHISSMHDKLTQMDSAIKNDLTLDDRSRRKQRSMLQENAYTEINRLSQKYPSAVRAQMLHNLRALK